MKAVIYSLIAVAFCPIYAAAQSKDTGWFIFNVSTGVIQQAESRTSKRIAGSVVIGMLVGEDGSILEAQPIRADNPLLQTGVVDTVLKWKFRPTVIGGVPVRVRTQATFTFN